MEGYKGRDIREAVRGIWLEEAIKMSKKDIEFVESKAYLIGYDAKGTERKLVISDMVPGKGVFVKAIFDDVNAVKIKNDIERLIKQYEEEK